MRSLFLILFMFICTNVFAYITFDGTDDFMDTNYSFSLGASDDFTIAFWAIAPTPTSTEEHFIGALWNDSDPAGDALIQIGLDTDTCSGYRMYISDDDRNLDGPLCSTGGVDAGNWQHFAVTYDDSAAQIRMFINGDIDSTHSSLTAVNAISLCDFLVGARARCTSSSSDDSFMDVSIEDLVIVEREMTDSEIKDLASHLRNKALDHDSDSTMRYYRMDDGGHGTSADGDTIVDSGTNGTDGSGNDGANNTGLTWNASDNLNY